MQSAGCFTGSNRGKRRAPAWLAGVLCLAYTIGVSTPAFAQGDTIVLREVSAWQRDMDRLRQELVAQRRVEAEFKRLLSGLQARLQSASNDSLRSQLRAQSQFVNNKLRETGTVQLRLRRDLESLCSAVRKPEGWLGVAITGFTIFDRQGDGPQTVRFMESPVIESVDPGSPADRAGLRSGDVLLEIAGRPLLQRKVVLAELLRPGERISVKAQRGREIFTVNPQVEPVPDAMSHAPCSWVDATTAYVLAPVPGESMFQVQVQTEPDSPERKFVITTPRAVWRDTVSAAERPATGFVGPMAQIFSGGVSPVAGMQLVPVNPDLGRTFGVAHGLLVIEVLPGTPGREAGLRGGDVLLSVNDVALRSTATLQRAIGRSQGRQVTIIYLRDKKQGTAKLRW